MGQRVKKGVEMEDGEFDVYWFLKWFDEAEKPAVADADKLTSTAVPSDLMVETAPNPDHKYPKCPVRGIFPIPTLNDKFAELMKELEEKFRDQIPAVKKTAEMRTPDEKWRGYALNEALEKSKEYRHPDRSIYQFLHCVQLLGLTFHFVTTKMVRKETKKVESEDENEVEEEEEKEE